MKDDDKSSKRVRPIGKLRRMYKITSTFLALVSIGYLLLITFPMALFAYSIDHGKFKVYSREPIQPEMNKVLDDAEARLRTSPLYDADISRRIYLTNGFGMYALLSNKAYTSFGNSVPFINNILINKTDVATDKVFVNRDIHNSRSLSGVIAHEVTHLFIRNKYGTVTTTLRIPTWKNEGYCEYIAGDSTIPLEEGIQLWRQNPVEDNAYRYVKYHLMVKYLLENEHLTVDELFTRDLNEKQVAEETFASFQQ